MVGASKVERVGLLDSCEWKVGTGSREAGHFLSGPGWDFFFSLLPQPVRKKGWRAIVARSHYYTNSIFLRYLPASLRHVGEQISVQAGDALVAFVISIDSRCINISILDHRLPSIFLLLTVPLSVKTQHLLVLS